MSRKAKEEDFEQALVRTMMQTCPIHKDVKLICPCCRAAEGGKARAKKNSKKKLRQWARMGGRPKKVKA